MDTGIHARLLGLAILILAASAIQAQNALWIDLSGPWRMIEGQERPEFAAPDFDDSAGLTVGTIRGGVEVFVNGQSVGPASGSQSCADAQAPHAMTFPIRRELQPEAETCGLRSASASAWSRTRYGDCRTRALVAHGPRNCARGCRWRRVGAITK